MDFDVDPRVRVLSFEQLRAVTDGFRTKIGSGATGDVFSGTHEGVGVAVKRLNLPAGASPEARAHLRRRFLAELRTLAAMHHVRLVQLRGYAIDESAAAIHPFALVYELLEGGSLADWLKGVAGEAPARMVGPGAGPARCALTALQRLEIAIGIASGLAYLHGQEEPADDGAAAAAGAAAAGAAGGAGAAPAAAPRRVVLHRDIKSANIGLGVLAGGALHAKLLDFGLARALRGDVAPGAGAAAAGTSTSIGAGTPGYMAPELGNTGPSVQTDVYAFGVVLLELLSGQRANAAAVSRLLEDAEEAGPVGGAALIAAQAEPGIWPVEAVTALSHLIVACTRVFARRRLANVADAITRLRPLRALLAPAAPLAIMCDACLEQYPASDIVTCPAAAAAGAGARGAAARAAERHNVCLGCLQRHVATIEAIAIDMNDGCVPCPCPGCTSPGWALDEITDRVDKGTHRALTAKLARLATAARSRRAFDAEMQDKIDRGLRNGGTAVGGAGAGAIALAGTADLAARAALLADVIRERDLTLRCPRCALPYAEINGCNAVLCGSRDAAAGIDLSRYGCGARFCGVCCREFPTAAANHAHHATAHGDYMDKALLKRAQSELRAAATVLALQSFVPGAGGAELQRAVAATLGDVVLGAVGLKVASLLERAGVPKAVPPMREDGTAGRPSAAEPPGGPAAATAAASKAAALFAAASAVIAPAPAPAMISPSEAANSSLQAALEGKRGSGAISAFAAWFAADVARAAQVTKIELMQRDLHDRNIAPLVRYLERMPRLERLSLHDNNIGRIGASVVADGLEALPRLQHLDLGRNDMGHSGASHVAARLVHVPRLRHLSLAFNTIGSTGAEAVCAALGGLRELKHLDLGSNSIGFAGALAVASKLESLPRLEYLDVSSNKIGDLGVAAIAAYLPRMPLLAHLHMGFNDITASGLDPLWGLSRMPSLTRLELNGNRLGVDGAGRVAAGLARLPQLQALNLSATGMGDAGAERIAAALASVPRLKHLALENNAIGSTGVAQLALALVHIPSLRELDLSGNGIGNGGSTSLAAALPHVPQLRCLLLRGNGIGDDGAASLRGSLVHLPRLRKLDLTINDRITRAATDAIKAHITVHKLRCRLEK